MDFATDFNLVSLEEVTQEHQRWLGLYRDLVTKAIRLGMRQQVARRRNANYLRAFISTRENDNARLERAISAGIEAGATARCKFGV